MFRRQLVAKLEIMLAEIRQNPVFNMIHKCYSSVIKSELFHDYNIYLICPTNQVKHFGGMFPSASLRVFGFKFHSPENITSRE